MVCSVHWIPASNMNNSIFRAMKWDQLVTNLICVMKSTGYYIRKCACTYIQSWAVAKRKLPYLNKVVAMQTSIWPVTKTFQRRIIAARYRSGVGVTKAPFANFSVRKIFDLAKVPVRFPESHSYLTGVTAAELRQHLPNINVIFNS